MERELVGYQYIYNFARPTYIYFEYESEYLYGDDKKYHNQITKLSEKHLEYIAESRCKYLNFSKSSPPDIVFSGDLNNLPSNIEGIILPIYYNQEITHFPANLKELIFEEEDYGSEWTHPLDNLPMGLERLQIPYGYNHSLANLPPTLLYLDFSVNGEAKDIDNLPDSIEILILNYHDFPSKFPKNLKKLVISKENYEKNEELVKKLEETEKFEIEINCYTKILYGM